ncbi:MAG: 5-formyltetrahydrofolate cyclo-ligase [Woeseiaceae bacterium]|nr:5-formyltetrahydrofolate cyclo-ligase [Woeseiaceae bacterium]
MNRRTDAIDAARKSAIAARRSLDPGVRQSASAAISEHVCRMHEFMACKSIACYLPADDEVDPTMIISRAWRIGKQVYSPVVADHGAMVFRRLTADTSLRRNVFGIWEPEEGPQIPAQKIDLVITPVVAFDAYNHRIGMGSGYFDRCFSFLKHRKRWQKPKLVGIAFKCQQVKKIIPNPWDIRLYEVITED